jgi:hypothetical protein
MRTEGQLGKSKTLDERPELLPTCRWMWEIYVALDGSRGTGMSGPVPITASDIFSYCELVGIRDTETREEILYFVKRLDPISLEDFYRRQKAQSKK